MLFGSGLSITKRALKASNVIPSGPPVSLALPIISGVYEQFQTLTCTNTTWSGALPITYTYQWKREGVDISAAINSTYVPTYLDVGFTLTCTVTATNANGSASVTSAPTPTINIVSVALPTVPSMIFAFEPGDLSSSYITLDQTFAPASVDTGNSKLTLTGLNFSAYGGSSGDFKGAPVFFSSTGTLPSPLVASTPYYLSPNAVSGYDIYPTMSSSDHPTMPSQVYFEEPLPAQNFIERTNKIVLTTQGTGTHRIYSEALIDKIYDRLGSGCTIENRVPGDRQAALRVQIDGNGRHVVSREIARDPRANEGGTYNLYGPSPVQGGITNLAARQAITNRRAGWVTHVARIIPNNNRNIRKNILAPAAVNTSTGAITYDNINGRFSTGDRVKFKAPPAGNAIPTGFTAGTSYYVRLGAGSTTYTLHPTALDATNNTNVIIPTVAGTGIFVLFAPERVGDGHRQMFFLEWLEANGGQNFITSFPKYSGPTNRGIIAASAWTLDDTGTPKNGDILGIKGYRDLTRIEIWFAPEATRPIRLDTGAALADGFYYVTGYVGGSSYGRLHDTLAQAQACVGVATISCSQTNMIKYDSGTPVVGECLFTYGGGYVPWALNAQWTGGITPQTQGEDETFTTDRLPYGVAGDPVHTFTFYFDNNNPTKTTPIAKLFIDGVKQGEYVLDGTKGQSDSTAGSGQPAWTWLNSAALHVPFTGDIYATYMGASTSSEVPESEILALHQYTFQKFAVTQGPPVPIAPANTALPVITGTLTTGNTLQCSTGTWSEYPVGTKTYQWKRSGANIAGATGSEYLLIAPDADQTITCEVTSTNASGAATAAAVGVGPIVGVPAAPTVATGNAISGNVNEGFVLTLSPRAVWNGYPDPTVTIQWKRNGTAISGATSTTYTTVSADAGATITCTETATNASGSANTTSNSLGPIIAAPSYEAEATTLFGRMSPSPNAQTKFDINKMIKALKDAGVWTKLDMLQVYAVPDVSYAVLDWKNGSRTASVVAGTSAPSFTADRGYTGTSTTGGYIDTSYNSTTAAGSYVQNSAHLGAYVVAQGTNVTAAGAAVLGVTRAFLIPRTSTTGQHTFAVNNTSSNYVEAGLASAIHHYVASRAASTGFDVYRDGASIATQTSTSVTPTNANMRALSREGSTNITDHRVAIVHAGGALTAQNVADMYSAFNTYLVARGAV